MKYDPRIYWQERLSKDFSLKGSGYLKLGIQYNKWLYKARLRALTKLLKLAKINPQGKRILDLGVGTGFYIDYWKKLGANSIVGIDITERSISELEKKYPEYKFIRADISDNQLANFFYEKFDIITAFDVLFHIVEEDKFQQTLINMAQLSHQNTQILITDNFLKEPRSPEFHVYYRTMDRYKDALNKAGLKAVVAIPVFYFMSKPIDRNALNSRLLKIVVQGVWFFVAKLPLLRKRLGPIGEAIGFILGLILYIADGFVLKYAGCNPSTKLLLVQLENVKSKRKNNSFPFSIKNAINRRN